MLINKHIGYDATDGMGIDGAIFQQELLELDGMGKTAIQVWVNSPGGVVMDGYNIFNAILKSKTPVDTYNTGIAASIAGVIFMAGRKRIMSDYANLMMHNPFGGDDKKQIAAMKDSLVTMLAAKTSIAEPEVSFLMDRTTWLNASECFAKGFCTDIEVTKEENKKRMPVLNVEDIATVKNAWRESNLILNNIFKTNTKMNKVTNKLGLIDDASEENIVAAIETVVNRATKADAELIEARAALKLAEDKVKALETQNKAFTDAAEEAKATAETEKANAQKVVVNTLIDQAVATGRIKIEAKAQWEATAEKVGADEVKALLEALPLNKVANKIAPATNPVTVGAGQFAGAAMAAVRDRLSM